MAEKIIEFGDMAADALTSKLKENETQLFNLKLQNGLGKLENTAQVRQARRDIARMKTVLRAKHLKSVAK